MLRRSVALVVAFIAAFFALPAAGASPPDATMQSLVCVYASPAHDLPTNHTAADSGPSAQRAEAVGSAGQRAADRASHGVLVRPDASETCGHITYDRTARLVPVDNPGTTSRQHVAAPAGDLASLQRSHVAAKGADEAFSAGKYLNDTWYKSTFPNRTQSVQYHLAKHGKGRTAVEYTQDAMDFFAQNRSLGQSVILRDGTAGIKISTKQPLPGGGFQRVGGYWTNDGSLVTFWD